MIPPPRRPARRRSISGSVRGIDSRLTPEKWPTDRSTEPYFLTINWRARARRGRFHRTSRSTDDRLVEAIEGCVDQHPNVRRGGKGPVEIAKESCFRYILPEGARTIRVQTIDEP